MNYVLTLVMLAAIYIGLAYSLNLVVASGGMGSFLHAAFFGIGAYGYAIFTKSAGFSPTGAMLLALSLAVILGVWIGLICIRFRSDLFMFVTLAFQIILSAFMQNWKAMTNGPFGISDIAPLALNIPNLSLDHRFLITIVLLDLVVVGGVLFIQRSAFGLALVSASIDEPMTQTLGHSPSMLRMIAFVISSGMAGVLGAFYAGYFGYIDPTAFGLSESIFVFSIVVLGGQGSSWSPALATLGLIGLPPLLRLVDLPDSVAANIRGLIYGALLVVFSFIRPSGLIRPSSRAAT